MILLDRCSELALAIFNRASVVLDWVSIFLLGSIWVFISLSKILISSRASVISLVLLFAESFYIILGDMSSVSIASSTISSWLIWSGSQPVYYCWNGPNSSVFFCKPCLYLFQTFSCAFLTVHPFIPCLLLNLFPRSLQIKLLVLYFFLLNFSFNFLVYPESGQTKTIFQRIPYWLAIVIDNILPDERSVNRLATLPFQTTY